MLVARTEEAGERIRDIRKAKNLTIKDVSEKAGVTIGLISQIERNLANPSLKSLQKIADVLEVPVVSFFSPRMKNPGPVIHSAEQRELSSTQNNVSYWQITPDNSTSLGMILAVYEPGAKTNEFLFLHTGIECCYIIEGTMKIILGHREYTMEAGDSITINGMSPHYIENPGENKLKTLWALTPLPY